MNEINAIIYVYVYYEASGMLLSETNNNFRGQNLFSPLYSKSFFVQNSISRHLLIDFLWFCDKYYEGISFTT